MPMDYAFIPGAGQEFDRLRTLVGRRANTTLISGPGVTTINDFLAHLKTNSLKGGDLIIGSHGTDEGQLQIAMDKQILAHPDPKFGPITTYENLQQHHTITIPSSVQSPDTSVRLFGCLLGSDETLPFLTLLKQGFAVSKNVSAARFLHTLHTDNGTDFIELMRYQFRIFSRDNFQSRKALVDAFAGDPTLLTLDTKRIPRTSWEAWMPIGVRLAPALTPATTDTIPFDFRVQISDGAGGTKIVYDQMGTCVSVLEQYTETGRFVGTLPTDQAALQALVNQAINADPAFVSSDPQHPHPYPIFKRYHFAKIQDFAPGWHWTTVKGAGDIVTFLGTRYRYELRIPVTKPGTVNDLIYNDYPSSGSPTINFSEANTQFKMFGVV